MRYYSTSDRSMHFTLEEAVMKGLASDGGLFMPERIGVLQESFWKRFPEMNFFEISSAVMAQFVGEEDGLDSKGILNSVLQFDAPLIKVEESMYALELFHGPTLAFKDFGARFLAAVMGSWAQRRNHELTVLVATSGDTGGAVAHGFFNVPGIKVVVLYPSGKVSKMQENQFATLGGNITALEITGTFDDCQNLVKRSFNDGGLRSSIALTSANSINVARLIPQMFYYFWAVRQLKTTTPVAISVPSGNFGNLTAGLMSKRMGLPVQQFIASTNLNDVFPEFLLRGEFKPRPSISTASNAMDVGNPSNFLRIMDLYGNDRAILSQDVIGFRIDEEETFQSMRDLYRQGYIIDPHGAVAYAGLKKYLNGKKGGTGIFLATAHPAKFRDRVETTLECEVALPEKLLQLVSRKKLSIPMENNFETLKEFLIST